jgi:hypothetical protein
MLRRITKRRKQNAVCGLCTWLGFFLEGVKELEKCLQKESLRKTKWLWEDNIKMDRRRADYVTAWWKKLAQVFRQLLVLVVGILNLRVIYRKVS